MKELLAIQPNSIEGQPWMAILPFNEEMVKDGFAGMWSYLVDSVKELGINQGVTLTQDVEWWIGDRFSDTPPYGFPPPA